MDFRRAPTETARAYEQANKSLLAESLALCEELLPGGRRQGHEYVCADLGGGSGRSLSVNLETGKWADFSDDDQRGGDLVNLWAAVREIEQHEAKAEALDWLRGRARAPKTDETDKLWWRGHPADKIWEYCDAKGNVVVQVKRWNAREGHSKVIRPWNPASQRYEWPDMDGRPLFNLRSILAGYDLPVVIVGGEKCADAVSEIEYSFVSTTVMGGESAVSRTDFSPLADRSVIVWADNDAAGDKWADKIIDALKEAGVASVHRVEIPDGKPPKWDAADASLKERNELLTTTLHDAPVVRGTYALRADEIAKGDPPPRRWIVRGAIPKAVPSVLFGPGASGKSLAVLDLCLKVAARDLYGDLGDPDTFLGPVPAEAAGPVMFVTLEDDKSELHRRLHAIDPGNKRAGAPLFIVPGLDIEGFDPSLIRHENRAVMLTRLATHGLPQLLRSVAKKAGRNPVLLALDPAGDFLEGSEDDAAIIKPLMRYFRELAAKWDIAEIIIGHTAKGQGDADTIVTKGMRGSGAWTANSRFAFGFWRPTYGQSVRFLKDIGEPPIERNLERVVFGRVMKANHPGAPTGIRKYMQDPETGLPIDMTARVQMHQATPEMMKAQILLAVKVMAEHGMPFTETGENSPATRRLHLPEGPLREEDQVSGKVIAGLVKELRAEGAIKQYKWTNGPVKKPVYLDVPGGPVDKNLVEPAVSDPDDPYGNYPA